MNKTDYPTRNPLTDISQVMRECHGAIVVAFERTYFESGLEKQQIALNRLLKKGRLPLTLNCESDSYANKGMAGGIDARFGCADG
jgi:hypothetical protein